MNIILVSGKSNSGKGTVARKIKKLLNNQERYTILCSLSTYIRDVAKEDYFWNGVDTLESRKFMAEVYRVGTEFYPYHMARRVWERDIQPYSNTYKTAIIESFREKVNYDYFNELLKQKIINKITTVRVIRPNFNVLQNKEMENHVSESDLDDFDFDHVIYNDGTVEELDEKLKEIFNDNKNQTLSRLR